MAFVYLETQVNQVVCGGSAGRNPEAGLVDWDRLDVLITSSRRRVAALAFLQEANKPM